ncbi:MAG TPA: hypothetical protein VF618_24840 [Thermoanaerobaculia bacterium]
MSANRPVLKAVLILGLTFLAGTALGIFIGHMDAVRRRAFPPPPHAAEWGARHLDGVLDLSDAQRAQVKQILATHHARMTVTWRGARDSMRGEAELANQEIDRILTPEQRARFAKVKFLHRRRPLIPFH